MAGSRNWVARGVGRLSLSMALLFVGAAGCGGDEPTSVDGGLTGELLVSAAASLTDVFADIEIALEATHPDLDVVLNLGGSTTLREQILAGAPADVFASADLANMEALLAADEAEEPSVFARNRLQLAVPAGNPAHVTGLSDLKDPTLFVGLCAPDVPCGSLAREALERAGVDPSVDTYEPDVRALLTKIVEGELDVGVTYATDVVAAGDNVEGIALPEDVDVAAEYPIAVLTGAPNPDAATAFVAFVLSDEAQAILDRHGFARP